MRTVTGSELRIKSRWTDSSPSATPPPRSHSHSSNICLASFISANPYIPTPLSLITLPVAAPWRYISVLMDPPPQANRVVNQVTLPLLTSHVCMYKICTLNKTNFTRHTHTHTQMACPNSIHTHVPYSTLIHPCLHGNSAAHDHISG